MGKRGKELRQLNLATARREQSAEQREHRVARRKRCEHVAIAFNVGASEKAAIGFPSADALTPFGDGALHTSDHIWAADFRLRFGDNGQRSTVDSIISADWDHDSVGTQEFSDNHTQKVAAEKAESVPFRSKEEWAIAVAIGGDYRIECLTGFAIEGLEGVELGLIDSFGIDRHKGFAAATRGDFSAEILEDLHQQITSDGGVLVGEKFHAVECFAMEKVKETLDVGGFAFYYGRKKAGLSVAKDALIVEEGLNTGLSEELMASDLDSVVNGLLVLF